MLKLIALSALFIVIECHGDHENFQFDPNSDESKEHLKEDLSNVIDKKVEDMNVNELQFHYFKQHDFDNNEKLDGLELLMSITHHESESDSQEKRVFTDYQLKSVVEGILENHDKNDDGFMDFNEYITPIRAEDRQKQKR